MEGKNFFDSFSSKTAFILGAVSAVFVLCTIGFIILLAVIFHDGEFNLGKAQANNQAVGQQPNDAVAPAAQPVPEVSKDDHIRGNKNAKITIVEYSDFECPFCRRFHQETMVPLLAKYPNDIRWVYRHYPLDGLHPTARPAAEASECVVDLAGKDAFWKFADKIFDGAQPPTADKTRAYAIELGINAKKYDDCVANRTFAQKVSEQEQAGAAAGVQGTPGNFLIDQDGQVTEIPGAQPLANVEAAVQQLLNKK